MNPRLTPAQIDEILAGAEHVDVPAEQLVAAAAEIRATLLAASDGVALHLAPPTEHDEAPRRGVDRVRRARVVRTALVAAALSLALLLSAAVSGALPDPIQERVAWVAEFFGLDLPEPALQPAIDASTGAQQVAGSRDAGSDLGRPTAVGTTGSTGAAPVASTSAPGAAAEPTGPTENNGKGPADNPGNDPTENNGTGPTDNPGNGPTDNPGNGPTDNPGNGPTDNPGKGPTENNGTGPTEDLGTVG